MNLFRSLYRKRMMKLMRSLPDKRREEVAAQVLSNLTEWEAFRGLMPRPFFGLLHSRREREEAVATFDRLMAEAEAGSNPSLQRTGSPSAASPPAAHLPSQAPPARRR